MTTQERCPWAGEGAMADYHDTEWGVPVHDDRHQFELLSLEGAQAGLSWRTILNKRPGYRAAFSNFDPVIVATYDDRDVERLMADAGIVRNRLKVTSVIDNARALLALQEEQSFDDYLWGFVDGAPIVNAFAEMAEIPAKTPISEAISKDLRRRGFRFVGPTIVYAHLQSAGLVLDHLTSCPRWTALRD
jgi:DNA-3-methyladenine glycosylase I